MYLRPVEDRTEFGLFGGRLSVEKVCYLIYTFLAATIMCKKAYFLDTKTAKIFQTKTTFPDQ